MRYWSGHLLHKGKERNKIQLHDNRRNVSNYSRLKTQVKNLENIFKSVTNEQPCQPLGPTQNHCKRVKTQPHITEVKLKMLEKVQHRGFGGATTSQDFFLIGFKRKFAFSVVLRYADFFENNQSINKK